jgi:hypothetical protein
MMKRIFGRVILRRRLISVSAGEDRDAAGKSQT